MRLLHHEDIVSALRAGFAPADIFEVADAAALAIHIIRNIAVIEENGVGIINHLPRRLPFADRVTVFSESGCGFQSEGMDGYIRRRERDDSINGFLKLSSVSPGSPAIRSTFIFSNPLFSARA